MNEPGPPHTNWLDPYDPRRRREPVMDFLRPASWDEALAAKAEHPTAVPIAGGTDVMVEINFDHRRPEYLLDLNRIGDLYEWEVGADSVRLGASVPYTRIMENLRAELPGLSLALPHGRLPADPQPRRRRRQPRYRLPGRRRAPRAPRGRRRGRGRVGARQPPYPDRRVLHRREAQRARSRRADPGRPHQEGRRPPAVLKVGTRNAMVIAVCAFGLALHPATRTVRTGIGSAAPTPSGRRPPRNS